MLYCTVYTGSDRNSFFSLLFPLLFGYLSEQYLYCWMIDQMEQLVKETKFVQTFVSTKLNNINLSSKWLVDLLFLHFFFWPVYFFRIRALVAAYSNIFILSHRIVRYCVFFF